MSYGVRPLRLSFVINDFSYYLNDRSRLNRRTFELSLVVKRVKYIGRRRLVSDLCVRNKLTYTMRISSKFNAETAVIY